MLQPYSLGLSRTRMARSAIFSVILVLSSSVSAEHGRDYSAQYDLGPPTTLDATHVSVPVSLLLQNHSGSDLADASIVLAARPWMPGPASAGVRRAPVAPGPRAATVAGGATVANGETVANGVTVAYRNHVELNFSVTTTSAEYREWARGRAPALRVRRMDPAGKPVERAIELMRLPQLRAQR